MDCDMLANRACSVESKVYVEAGECRLRWESAHVLSRWTGRPRSWMEGRRSSRQTGSAPSATWAVRFPTGSPIRPTSSVRGRWRTGWSKRAQGKGCASHWR